MSGPICVGDLVEFRITAERAESRIQFIVEQRHNMMPQGSVFFAEVDRARVHVFLAWNQAASLGATVTIRDEVE